ncbi:MAG: THUMP domain-containing protein [Thermoprotei archaeon]
MFVAHYSEIALRGANRGRYVGLLIKNIRSAVGGYASSVRHVDARLVGELSGDAWGEVERRLSRVFGVAWYANAKLIPHDYDALKEHCVRLALEAGGRGVRTFGIRVRRAGDYWVTGSLELAKRLGADVEQFGGLEVDLEHPGLEIFVDVVREGFLVYTSKRKGPGGLPLGSSGSVVHLLSGGVDSAVAAWLLMKRGVTPIYLHFYAYPSVEYVLDSKVFRVAQALSLYSGASTLITTPFTKYQLASIMLVDRVEPVLFRYFMRRFAERVALAVGAKAVSFGDSIAQVASQTLENIAAVDHNSRLPVFRPLLTYNKQETLDLARSIGLYEHTVQPYKDCCSIVTRHPNTRVAIEKVEEVYDRLRLDELIDQLQEDSHVIIVRPENVGYELLGFRVWLQRVAQSRRHTREPSMV